MKQRTRIRRAQQGDDFRVHMSASTWNAFADAAESLSYDSDGRGLPQTGVGRPDITQASYGATGCDFKQVTTITTPRTQDELGEPWAASEPIFVGTDPGVDDHGSFGLTLDGGKNLVPQVITGGIVSCMLHVPANGEWIKWADMDSADASRLIARPNGSAEILWKKTSGVTFPDTVEAVVRLGLPAARVVMGKAKGELTVGGASNTVTAWTDAQTDTGYDIENVALDWMADGQDISDGKEVVVCWMPELNVWRVLWAQCEDSGEQPTVPYNAEWGGYY